MQAQIQQVIVVDWHIDDTNIFYIIFFTGINVSPSLSR